MKKYKTHNKRNTKCDIKKYKHKFKEIRNANKWIQYTMWNKEIQNTKLKQYKTQNKERW